jgi:hypothetical protein
MILRNKIFLGFLLSLFILALIPSKTSALLPNSYDQTVNDYFFLKYSVVNNSTSAVSGFTIPPEGTNWMIEVDAIDNSTSWDILNGSVYQESTDYLNFCEPTIFGANSFEFGRYNGSSFIIGNELESQFPVPFIVPVDMCAVFNQTLNVSLCKHFENYMYMNGTALMALLGSMGEIVPIEIFGIAIAWNGSSMIWLPRNMRYDPYGNQTGNALLVAVYFGDGELTYLRESWWDNTTIQGDGFGTWRTSYKLVSPLMDLIGSFFEGMFPGSDVSMGGIPGFPCAAVFLGLIATAGIIYLRKPKSRVLF